MKRSRNKYGAKKTEVNGIVFDSMAEAGRYKHLKRLEEVGKIESLELQPAFVLQPSFKHQGKTIRAITYKADFKYTEGSEDGQKAVVVVEDKKGFRTEVYKLKRKMLLHKIESEGLNLEFRET